MLEMKRFMMRYTHYPIRISVVGVPTVKKMTVVVGTRTLLLSYIVVPAGAPYIFVIRIILLSVDGFRYEI